jgi:hypothetical protein
VVPFAAPPLPACDEAELDQECRIGSSEEDWGFTKILNYEFFQSMKNSASYSKNGFDELGKTLLF